MPGPQRVNAPLPATSDDKFDLDAINNQITSDESEDEDLQSVVSHLRDDATTEELRKALADAQQTVASLRGKFKTLGLQVAVHDAREAKSQGKKVANLNNIEMAIELQNDTIRTLGRKYSMTHCFWANPEIFPLTTNPNVALNGVERWLSPLSIEDAIKTELFQFVPSDLHPLMANKKFGELFCHGIQTSRCEAVSDLKACAGSIFGLSAEFFVRGYSRSGEPSCRELLLSKKNLYTKFAPVLFPDPKHTGNKALLLKMATLVKILKVTLFGKSSLSGQNAPGPCPKGRIWELRHTTTGMIAAAAVLAIFILSGDANFYQTGETSKIPYTEYHNYYRQQLLADTPWAQSVFSFFNAALFPDSSKSAHSSAQLPDTVNDDADSEAEFEQASRQAQALRSVSSTASRVVNANAAPSISAPMIPVPAAPSFAPPHVPAIPAAAVPVSIVAGPPVHVASVTVVHENHVGTVPGLVAVPQFVLPTGPSEDDNIEVVAPAVKGKGVAGKAKRKGKVNLKGLGVAAVTAGADDDGTGVDAYEAPAPASDPPTISRRSGRAKQTTAK